jgi:hypothetical protein
MIRKKTFGIISLFAVIAVLIVGCSKNEATFDDGVRTNPDYGIVKNITVAKPEPDTTLVDCVVYISSDTDIICDWEHISKNTKPTSIDKPNTFIFNSFINREGSVENVCIVAKYDSSGSGIDCEF